MAFEEDCARADIVVSALTAPAGCKAAAGVRRAAPRRDRRCRPHLDGDGFTLATDRAQLEDRPWSPAPKRARSDRVERPGKSSASHADPADPIAEPLSP